TSSAPCSTASARRRSLGRASNRAAAVAVGRQPALAQTSGNADRFVTSAGRRLVEQLRAAAVYPGETVPFWKGISGEKGVDCGRGGARACRVRTGLGPRGADRVQRSAAGIVR